MDDSEPIRESRFPGRNVPTIAMTRLEAARSIGISLSSFQRYVEPDLPRVYLGERIVLYRTEDIENWIRLRAAELPQGRSPR